MKLFFSLCFSFCFLSLSAQNQAYWIFLEGKNLADAPALSADAIESRLRQNIALDAKDLPVSKVFLQEIAKVEGVKIRSASRWLNAVSLSCEAQVLPQIQALPFVHAVAPIRNMISANANSELRCKDDLNTPQRQLNMLAIPSLHNLCYTGKGVKIAVLDNGFDHVDTLSGMKAIFSQGRMLYSRDFVEGETDVLDDCNGSACQHGLRCFSIIGANLDTAFKGSAPDASFYLFRTENDASETLVEEDNWVRAAEEADSLGVQVISSSLNYNTFDNVAENHLPSDMDGKTAIISRAAATAATRGIIVVNSAGNFGGGSWNIIGAPADADSIIAVGAVDQLGAIASFSSRGPSADGRTKPEVVAMGVQTFLLAPNGAVQRGNGTSYATPVVAGMMACLRQINPNMPAYQLRTLLLETASQAKNPDTAYGYGLPNADSLLTKILPAQSSEFLLWPNPGNSFCMRWQESKTRTVLISLYDNQGRKVYQVEKAVTVGLQGHATPLLDLRNGVYHVVVQDKDTQETLYYSRWVHE